MDHFTARPSRMRLYNRNNERLYVNATERVRILEVARTSDPGINSFCLTLLYTGCRISEALELRPCDIQLEERVLTLRTLKRRAPDICREVPMPVDLVQTIQEANLLNVESSERLWGGVDRITAYRWIKGVMHAAEITGVQACPKGLRHGYGIAAAMACVPLTMIQKWMGHASITTTAIYLDAVGPEQLTIADRMWR